MAVLDKQFHHLFIGKNILSLVAAIGLLKRDKKVLLIDDQDASYGECYLARVSDWEKDFLLTYSEDELIETLPQIDQYLTPVIQSYCIEDRFLLFAHSPYLNLVELMRKFPEFFPLDKLPEWREFMKGADAQKEFDDIFQKTVRRVAASSARFSGFERQPVDFFVSQCPEIIQKVIALFIERLSSLANEQSDEGDLCKTFLYLTQGLFHFQLKITCQPLELFHLFVSLISCRYELDLSMLTQDLLQEFKACGGQFKRTSIREWKFHNDRPWSVELRSFDGIVHPQNVSFFAGLPENMAVRFTPDFSGYRALRVKSSAQENTVNSLRLRTYRTYVAKKEWIGTHFPWFAYQQGPEGKTEFLVPTLYPKGFKTSFVVKNLKSFLLHETSKFMASSSFSFDSFELSHDVWSQTIGGPTRSPGALRAQKQLSWHDGSRPQISAKLKNINYFGPLNDSSCGLISTLGQIKDFQLYQ